MKPDLLGTTGASAPAKDLGHEGLGYPFRAIVSTAATLSLGVIWLVLPLERGTAGTLTAIIGALSLALVGWRTRQLRRAREQSAHVLAALGAATAEIPVKLRTRMPLVLVTGDGLAALFNRTEDERFVHVGDGAIWLRVDQPQVLPRLAVALRQWRDGRAPDGVVLSVAPALHACTDTLTQKLRIARQAVADAARVLSAPLPSYMAVYQRLTPGPLIAEPQWYGVSSATRLTSAHRFEPMIRAAEHEAERASGDALAARRAAALASIVEWTQQVVVSALTDRRQPATSLALYGAGWIDSGPASGPNTPWERSVEIATCVLPSTRCASPMPWPLPQPLITAMPRRLWTSPRRVAIAHVLVLLAFAATASFWGAAKNNEALLSRIGADLFRYSAIPAAQDAVKRDALQALVAARDRLDGYARNGVPLRLSFGLYRGAQLMPALNDAIASYEPPPPPPVVVTLDSMSLFDSGKAKLKPGSTRAMVNALETIKTHPDKRILVAGHTDNVGKPDMNLKLSIARAGAVRDWLIEASGLPATQFAIQGYGDTRPIASNETPDGRARNRRVEITLVPDSGA